MKTSYLKMTKPYCATFLLAVALLLMFTASSGAKERLLENVYKPFATPAPLPEVLIEDASGHQTQKISDFHGKWVLLNIWATWCAHCVQEIEDLDKLQSIMGSSLVIVPLAIDHQGTATVPQFYRRHSVTHLPIMLDLEGFTPNRLNAPGLPSTFLINPEGIAVGQVSGPVVWTSEQSVSF